MSILFELVSKGSIRSVTGAMTMVATLAVIVVLSTPAAAQVENDPSLDAIIRNSNRTADGVYREFMRRQEYTSSVSTQADKRRRAEEAAARSRTQFLTKYNEFALRVRELLQEMEGKPEVVPLAKLRSVQKAWAAWQKCKEWPGAK